MENNASRHYYFKRRLLLPFRKERRANAIYNTPSSWNRYAIRSRYFNRRRKDANK